MAIALRATSPRPVRNPLRPLLALAAGLILTLGVALSGGFQLPPADSAAPALEAAGGTTPVFDNRGKWTGY